MEAQRVPPSAWRTSQSSQSVRLPSASKSHTARSARPISRWISTVRPSGRPRETPAACARRSRPGASSTRPSPPAPVPLEPPRMPSSTVAVQRTTVRPWRVQHLAVGCSRKSAGRSRSSRSRAAPVRASRGRRLERGDLDALRLCDRKLEEAPAHLAELDGSPVVRNRYAPHGPVLLDPLPASVSDTSRAISSAEKTSVPAPEDALEDGPDQRVVGTAEDHGVDARLLQRRGELRTAAPVSAEGIAAFDQRNEPRARERRTSTPASSASTSSA